MNLERARPVATPVHGVRGMSPNGGRVADCETPTRIRTEQAGRTVDTEAA